MGRGYKRRDLKGKYANFSFECIELTGFMGMEVDVFKRKMGKKERQVHIGYTRSCDLGYWEEWTEKGEMKGETAPLGKTEGDRPQRQASEINAIVVMVNTYVTK